MHLEAGMAVECVTWLKAPGRPQRTRTTTTPHEMEKILHELELLSLQGDSSETQCSPALHTYNHPKDTRTRKWTSNVGIWMATCLTNSLMAALQSLHWSFTIPTCLPFSTNPTPSYQSYFSSRSFSLVHSHNFVPDNFFIHVRQWAWSKSRIIIWYLPPQC